MIVCLCEGLNDRRIARAIEEGCRTVQDLARSTGAGSQCGACGCELKRMLAEHRARARAQREAELPLAAK
ncbi:MAG: (2Fe-2S)-binding protein [Myxococcales bacterium]|nr:(2Fe-2S)-binding protein [Myxococcales bacterium]